MSEHLLARMPDDPLAALLAARSRASEEDRQKTVRRALALLAVGLLHVLFIAVLVISGRVPLPARVKLPVEIQLRLTALPRATPPAPRLINARPVPAPMPTVREIEPLPITPTVTPQQAEVNALRALGQALACGASRYEYLSPVERKLCKRRPWKMPPEKNLAIAPPPPVPQGIMTGAEAEARFRQTAKPCPILQNTPCIDQVIYGKGPH